MVPFESFGTVSYSHFLARKDRLNLDIRKHFFSQRVVNVWNELPQHVVDAPSVNSFKNRLEKSLGRYYGAPLVPLQKKIFIIWWPPDNNYVVATR